MFGSEIYLQTSTEYHIYYKDIDIDIFLHIESSIVKIYNEAGRPNWRISIFSQY